MDNKKLDEWAKGTTISIPARMAISAGMMFVFAMPFAGLMNATGYGKEYAIYVLFGLPAVTAIVAIRWYKESFQFLFWLLSRRPGDARYNPETETVEHETTFVDDFFAKRRENEETAMREIANAMKKTKTPNSER